MNSYIKALDSIEQTFNYQTGTVPIKEGLATIIVPQGFKYLNGTDSETILTNVWGNPPSDPSDPSLGMLLPEDFKLRNDSMYAINITYTEDGYIDDEDAKEIDYDELLATMKSDAVASNEYRMENGYQSIELVNWASPPFYDAANKKLHWAQELKFGDSPQHTLNYNIRILGRKGYLQFNAIGEMFVLEQVKNNIDPILSSINFNSGNRYADFNPDLDEVAAYGIGGLIAGKALMKAGVLAKVGLVIAKFWKIIALAVLGFFGSIGKFFGKKEETPTVKQEA